MEFIVRLNAQPTGTVVATVEKVSTGSDEKPEILGSSEQIGPNTAVAWGTGFVYGYTTSANDPGPHHVQILDPEGLLS